MNKPGHEQSFSNAISPGQNFFYSLKLNVHRTEDAKFLD